VTLVHHGNRVLCTSCYHDSAAKAIDNILQHDASYSAKLVSVVCPSFCLQHFVVNVGFCYFSRCKYSK